MKILIVGAGVAGLTLAALLKKRGITAVIIDKAPNFQQAGYMLAIYSLGSRVLHGLGLYEKFLQESIAAYKFDLCDGGGRLIKGFDLNEIIKRMGDFRLIARAELMEMLYSGLEDTQVIFDTSVTELTQNNDEVLVKFSNGMEDKFELVIGCDGANSQIRKMLFGTASVYDTHWGGWIWWVDSQTYPRDTSTECWGKNSFLGIYPVKKSVGIFAGIRNKGHSKIQKGRKQLLLSRFSTLRKDLQHLLDFIPEDDEEMYYWKLADSQASQWSSGRVVLLGDAAAAFLPTAGVGASMAMESAAVLNDELSRTDAKHFENAINLYIKRRRARVAAIQKESRKLARLITVKNPLLFSIRNYMLPFSTINMLIKNISKALSQPI